MLQKINVLPILQEHVRSLRNHATDRISPTDILIFFVFPVAVAGFVTWRGFRLRPLAVNALVSSFSLFATILLSLLVMVFSFIQSTEKQRGDPLLSIRRRLLREINANIAFTVVLSVGIAAISLIALSTVSRDGDVVASPFTFMLVMAFITFLLNILMITKRMYLLMANELDRSRTRKSA
jgi:hypothetical protein